MYHPTRIIRIITLLLLMASLSMAGEVKMPRIKYKTHEGLEAQVNKILIDTVMRVGPDTCEYLTFPDSDSMWLKIHVAMHGTRPMNFKISNINRLDVLVQYECWDTTYFYRQPIGLEIVREPEYKIEPKVFEGIYNAIGYLEPPMDTTKVIGEAILIYEEVTK